MKLKYLQPPSSGSERLVFTKTTGTILIVFSALLASIMPSASAQSGFDEVLAQSIDIDPEPPGFSSADSNYGSAVALHDGRLIMAGASSPLLVFEKRDGLWEESQILFLPTGSSSPGDSKLALATAGNFVLIGDAKASAAPGSPETGLVYLAEWDGDRYQIRSSLSPEGTQTGLRFGTSLSMNADFLFVGAPGADNGQGRIFVYERPADFPNIALEIPVASLAPPSPAAHDFGQSLHSSDTWMVAKQQIQSPSQSVSAVGYSLSTAAFDAPVVIDLDWQSYETGGSAVHVREDIVLLRRRNSPGSTRMRSDYLQFRLSTSGAEELPSLRDDRVGRGFLPALAESAKGLHLVSVIEDGNFSVVEPEIFNAIWDGSSWALDQSPIAAPADLFSTLDDIQNISSAVADPAALMLGTPEHQPDGLDGGGVSIISLDEPSVLTQVLDAGRDGSFRMLGWSLARTDSSLVVGAPGWCTVYVLEATPPDFNLKQTLTASPPCAFGADVLADGEMLYIGDPLWQPSAGLNMPEEGQVHVFRLEGDAYVEQPPIRVLPHIGSRRLGQGLAMDSGHLFVAGGGEVFMFDPAQVTAGPQASASFGTVLGRTGMNLAAGHGMVLVSVSGRLGGLLSIFDIDLVGEETISDPASDFGLALAPLGPANFVTTRLESMAHYEFSGGTWSLSSSVSPAPPISRFGSSIETQSDQAWIGTASGFTSSRIDNGELSLDIPVAVLAPEFFEPAAELAAGNDPYSAFVGFPNGSVSQFKKDLLLFVEFDAVIKRDGFESQLP